MCRLRQQTDTDAWQPEEKDAVMTLKKKNSVAYLGVLNYAVDDRLERANPIPLFCHAFHVVYVLAGLM